MPTQRPVIIVERPNDLWTLDYKGWWLGAGSTRYEPLTLRDAYSRYVLDICLLNTTRADAAREVLEAAFRRYGLPKAILTDNGTPFVARHGKLGLTTLSAWWLSLGIKHIRSRPATPSDNGAHERMHRDMKNDLKRNPELAKRRCSQQAWDEWRTEFNCIRPHQALNMKVPADVYKNSTRPFREEPALLVYPAHFQVRIVDKIGKITLGKNRSAFLSHALRRLSLGLEPVGDVNYNVWLADTQLGALDFSEKRGLFIPS